MTVRKKTPPPEILALWSKWIDTNNGDNTERFFVRLRKLAPDAVFEHIHWLLRCPELGNFSSYGSGPSASRDVRNTVLDWSYKTNLLSLPHQLQLIKTLRSENLRCLALQRFISGKVETDFHERAQIILTLEAIQSPRILQTLIRSVCSQLMDCAHSPSSFPPSWYLVEHFTTAENQSNWKQVLEDVGFNATFFVQPKFFDFLLHAYPELRDALLRSIFCNPSHNIRNYVRHHPEEATLRVHLTQLLVEDLHSPKPQALDHTLDAREIHCWVETLGDPLHPEIEAFLRQRAWECVRDGDI